MHEGGKAGIWDEWNQVGWGFEKEKGGKCRWKWNLWGKFDGIRKGSWSFDQEDEKLKAWDSS